MITIEKIVLSKISFNARFIHYDTDGLIDARIHPSRYRFFDHILDKQRLLIILNDHRGELIVHFVDNEKSIKHKTIFNLFNFYAHQELFFQLLYLFGVDLTDTNIYVEDSSSLDHGGFLFNEEA